MSANPLAQLPSLGQSVWLDQMRRSLLSSGELKRLIEEDGLRGLTSNPTIFEKAIAGSNDYTEDLRRMAKQGASVEAIYEHLTLEDIRGAADVFRGVHESSQGSDGFASLEVSPLLAHDTAKTIQEAKTLFAKLGRPNVMIKVPATPEGIPAIEELIAAGLNVNVTLMFSVAVYEKVAEAYLRGLERRVAADEAVDRIASVASFFVSRIDTAVDRELERLLSQASDEKQKSRVRALRGKAAIANAKLAYESFRRIFRGKRWEALEAKGARPQRPLWASTSTKDPAYSDVLYVESLIGPDTVDTIPPHTLDAFRDHGRADATLETGMEEARKVFRELKTMGVDFQKVTDQLTTEGVEAFADSFRQLLDVIRARRDEATSCLLERQRASLGKYDLARAATLQRLQEERFVGRLWKKDATAWKLPEAHSAVIRNALGWLHVAEMMAEHAGELQSWAGEVRKAGFEHVVVLGMGGSSLCPEVLRRSFGRIKGYPQLYVLDSTVPAAIRRLDAQLDDRSTLFIAASKSGTTTEPQMFYRYYFDRVKRVLSGQAGERFVAITDAGTPLEQEARRDGFRRVFLNPGDIGGRYSALSYFGMVPFALMGGDVVALIGRALHAVHACAPSVAVNENPGARLGAALGSLARAGRNKLTLVTPPPIDSLGLWIEQLIAESTGKDGRGIVPVAGEALGSANDYGNDRVFVYVHVGMADDGIEQRLRALEAAGHPVLRRRLHDALDLGEEFFIWEFATAIAGALLEIDPFDQPNVQESKDNTKQLLAEYGRTGQLAEQAQLLAEGQLRVFADAGSRAALKGADGSLAALLRAHLGRVGPGDYVAITQYIEERPEHDELLEQLRLEVRAQTRAATTTGYGPRFLHSTGQLHKGGPDSGVFLQLTAGDTQDLDIPGESFTFGVLKQAQALGDFQSLARRGRRALRVDLGRDVERGLQQLLAALRGAASEQEARTVA